MLRFTHREHGRAESQVMCDRLQYTHAVSGQSPAHHTLAYDHTVVDLAALGLGSCIVVLLDRCRLACGRRGLGRACLRESIACRPLRRRRCHGSASNTGCDRSGCGRCGCRCDCRFRARWRGHAAANESPCHHRHSHLVFTRRTVACTGLCSVLTSLRSVYRHDTCCLLFCSLVSAISTRPRDSCCSSKDTDCLSVTLKTSFLQVSEGGRASARHYHIPDEIDAHGTLRSCLAHANTIDHSTALRSVIAGTLR